MIGETADIQDSWCVIVASITQHPNALATVEQTIEIQTCIGAQLIQVIYAPSFMHL